MSARLHVVSPVSRVRLLSALVALVAGLGLALVPGTGPGWRADAATPVPVADGSSPAQAAASCWEVKQRVPSATDGVYWLWTPQLVTPQQFRCDMSTDGGGWVLLGRGREGWQNWYHGQGDASALLGQRTDFSTTQLDSTVVDGLLGGTAVSSLADGVRVRRARNVEGTAWQEVRMQLPRRDRWVWTFDAPHTVGSFSFRDGAGTTSATGGAYDTTTNFGTDNRFNRLDFRFADWQKWTGGFAYGSQVPGTSGSSSYLWSANDGATFPRPYAEVWIRPRVTSSSFAAIGDSGTAARTLPDVASSWAQTGGWGVSGLATNYSGEGHVEVQDFAQSGSSVFVGGNFRWVQKGSSGTPVDQPYLAAFDTSGQWLSSFRPAVNGEVRSLAALPGGRVALGGSFTTVNGAARTGFAVVDATTGANVGGLDLQVENRVSGSALQVRSLSVRGDWLYLAGAFTHLTGSNGVARYARNAARVSLSTGQPDGGWNPELNGTVVSTDTTADGSRFYGAGYFTASGSTPASKAVAVQTVSGAPVATPSWNPTWSTDYLPSAYQQAVLSTDDRVWVGGSQHSIFGYSASTFQRLSASITLAGGDFQTLSAGRGAVYGGCHCNGESFQDTGTWPAVTGWTQADRISWIGAWDRSTGAFVPDFSPVIGSRASAGAWSSFVDSNGTLWAGGDFKNARSSRTAVTWAGGFVRFAQADATAPSRPTITSAAATSSGTALTWTAATDASGPVTYQVLRDDRVVATTTARTLTVPAGGEDRYFVRALDARGNASASSAVAVARTPSPDQPAQLVAAGSTWAYRYATGEPGSGWAGTSFDDSGWARGAAVIGFGSTPLGTNIDIQPTSARPQTAYFRRTITLADASALRGLRLTTRADDGIAVYVNGTEVTRSNLVAGATSTTYASSSRRTATATAAPVVVDVPVGLLRTGTNVISAEVHLNYRSAPDLSFELEADATWG